jgi:hypothetical protein
VPNKKKIISWHRTTWDKQKDGDGGKREVQEAA